MPVGNYLGQVIAGLPYCWVIIPIGMLIGYFIVKAEPAVYVLMEQVEILNEKLWVDVLEAGADGIILKTGDRESGAEGGCRWH